MKRVAIFLVAVLLAFGVLFGFAASVGFLPREPSLERFASLVNLATSWADDDIVQRFEFFRAVFTAVSDTYAVYTTDQTFEVHPYYLTDVESQYSDVIEYFTVDNGDGIVRIIYNPFGMKIAFGSDSEIEKKAMYYAENVAFNGLLLLYNWDSSINSAENAFERWLLRNVSRLFLVSLIVAEIAYVCIDVLVGSVIEICYFMGAYLDWLFEQPPSALMMLRG